MSLSLRCTVPCLLVAVSMLTVQPAAASTVPMRLAATAANACLPALPAYEGVIRKRPLSVQNEGGSAAFVTCSLAAANRAIASGVYFNSIDGQAHAINCTVVIGFNTGAPVYVTKAVTVPATGNQAYITVYPADVGRADDLGSEFASYSCQLPPGTGINDTFVTWMQEVGN